MDVAIASITEDDQKTRSNTGGGYMKENNWNIHRQGVDKFFLLSNNQWMKILFSYQSSINIWFMTIVVANTKRKCNDCIHKTESSPKVLYGKKTGKNLGLEPFKIALRELLQFEKTIHNTQINIVGASDRLKNIYKYLKRYNYKEYKYITNGEETSLMYKQIK